MASLLSILKRAGFTGEGLRMAYAIAMAESSGNARAHNGNASTGDNSYGLFQINMLGSMGPDRRRRYGLTSNDDLFDALTNARVAYKMSNGGKNWGPWSTYTSGAYRDYYGGSGASVYSSGGGGVTATSAKIDKEVLKEEYGLTDAMLKASPELSRLFNKAVAAGWDSTLFIAHLKEKKWWTQQSKTLREYITLKYTDPATWKQNNTAAWAKYNDLAIQQGLGNQMINGKATKLLRAVAYNALALGWTDDRIKDYLGARITTHSGDMWGDAGVNFDKLHELAYLNGMSYGKWFTDETRRIMSGTSTLETAEGKIRKDAAAKYSGFAAQIKAGQNVLDLAAPYIQSVSSILELPSTGVDLKNKYVNDAMTSAKPGASYPLWEFENKLRSDPLWLKTNNARESMMTTAHQVLKDFGVSF